MNIRTWEICTRVLLKRKPISFILLLCIEQIFRLSWPVEWVASALCGRFSQLCKLLTSMDASRQKGSRLYLKRCWNRPTFCRRSPQRLSPARLAVPSSSSTLRYCFQVFTLYKSHLLLRAGCSVCWTRRKMWTECFDQIIGRYQKDAWWLGCTVVRVSWLGWKFSHRTSIYTAAVSEQATQMLQNHVVLHYGFVIFLCRSLQRDPCCADTVASLNDSAWAVCPTWAQKLNPVFYVFLFAKCTQKALITGKHLVHINV